MKQLLTFAICAILFSCGNPKPAIVEQIKTCKDSVEAISTKEKRLTFLINNWHSKGGDLEKELSALSKNSKDLIELQYHRKYFQSKIDSLELELKKY